MFFWAKIEIGLPIFALLCDFFALDATKVIRDFSSKKNAIRNCHDHEITIPSLELVHIIS
jgi:hypothetical protein